jgi:hypothetical protein
MTRPGMSDGRCFTQYSPSTNQDIMKVNNIQTNAEYRLFLQNNAEEIMSQMQAMCKHSEQATCSLCVHTYKK